MLILIKLQAAKNFKIAADKVSTEAMFNYGLLLLNSYGFEIDKKDAARYYRMATDKGYVQIMYSLAIVR